MARANLIPLVQLQFCYFWSKPQNGAGRGCVQPTGRLEENQILVRVQYIWHSLADNVDTILPEV